MDTTGRNREPHASMLRQSMNVTHWSFSIDPRLVLPENEVHLWRADLDSMRAEQFRGLDILSADERIRSSRFHFPADRERFTAARAWLRYILAAYLQTDPRELAFDYSLKEKPALAPPHAASGLTFNLSHSGGIALYAVSRNRQLGVDVELIRRSSDLEGIARRFFSSHEQKQFFALPPEDRREAFFRCWTRKEAYIKATGDGLSLPLHQFDVSLEAGCRNALLATRPDPSEGQGWHLRQVSAGPGYAAALCVRGPECTLRDWSEPLA